LNCVFSVEFIMMSYNTNH